MKNKIQSHKGLLLITLLVACLVGISSDIYAPSLPAIAKDLKVPIDEIQWSMAIFMLGVSLSQLVYGPFDLGSFGAYAQGERRGSNNDCLKGIFIFMRRPYHCHQNILHSCKFCANK